MSEQTYLQVERAIRERLHVAGRYTTPLGGPSFEYPVAIENGNIVLRDGDCGLAKETRIITTDEWKQLTDDGARLYRRVDMWEFTLADDPAADAIAFAHSSPSTAGRELHRLRLLRIEEMESRPTEAPKT